MTHRIPVAMFVCVAICAHLHAQAPPPAQEAPVTTRYALAVIDDTTFYSDRPVSQPAILNQVLMEPAFGLRYQDRFTFSTSLIGAFTTHADTASTVRVKESYTGLSAGDFDFTDTFRRPFRTS